jgi:Domain of unknown function (DUF4159)
MFRAFAAALRDWWKGVGYLSASSCSGDPLAAERDAKERHRARQAALAVAADPAPPSRSPLKNSRTLGITIVIVLGLGSLAWAQFGRFFGGEGRDPRLHNVPYDGRFTFARLKYTTAPGGYWYQGLPSWAHGYPLSEDNLMRIMKEITYLDARTDGYDVFSLDDPELMKYPLCYITEAGWWTLNESERDAFRAYLQKGGFVIFDDFKVENDFGPGGGWDPFEKNIRAIFPDVRFVPMDPSHPIFHSFFEINTLENFPQAYNAGAPIFRGIYEDNDRNKRLIAIINYNTDISQYWEWSGRGLRPFDETNEAYKLGVNYVIYGMTH